jgi:radical SAM protein with 4Fe4S-binding SPASM domain
MKDLHFGLAQKAILEAVECGCRAIHLTGGEPFLYGNLSDIFNFAIVKGIQNICITSNGIAINDWALLTDVNSKVDFNIALSLDGPEDINDAIRGEKTFRLIEECLAKLRKYRISFSIFTNITHLLIPRLDKWIGHILRVYPDACSLVFFINSGTGMTPEFRPLKPGELISVAKIVAKYMLKNANIRISSYPIMNILLRKHAVDKKYFYQCRAGRGRFTLTSTGEAQVCHPAYYAFGYYNNISFKKVAVCKEYALMANREYAGCSHCSYKNICGNCRAYVLFRTGNVFGNDYSCKEIISFVEKNDRVGYYFR